MLIAFKKSTEDKAKILMTYLPKKLLKHYFGVKHNEKLTMEHLLNQPEKVKQLWEQAKTAHWDISANKDAIFLSLETPEFSCYIDKPQFFLELADTIAEREWIENIYMSFKPYIGGSNNYSVTFHYVYPEKIPSVELWKHFKGQAIYIEIKFNQIPDYSSVIKIMHIFLKNMHRYGNVLEAKRKELKRREENEGKEE